MKETELLKVIDIIKNYHGHTVLDGISLNINPGDGIALVGENGCGKSTLLRILAGLTNQDKGSFFRKTGLKMAWIPDHFDGTPYTLNQFLQEMMKVEGIFDEEHKKRLMEYYHEFALDDMLSIKMNQLSKGTLQKAAVLQAMIGEYDIIFMDEPLSGQDYHSQIYFAEQMKEKRQQGTALIMACHEPFLVEQCAEQVFQISKGKLVDGASYINNCQKEGQKHED